MAKRVRGSSRPGQRRPVTRRPAAPGARASAAGTSAAGTSAASAAAVPRSSGLTDAEIQRAAELEAQLVAEEQAAQAARRRSQERTVVTREVAATRTIRPEEEYAYVVRDLRDIVRIALLLLAILLALYVVIDVAGVFKIT
jgi:hypothetical protein